jgi:hypothetical protein
MGSLFVFPAKVRPHLEGFDFVDLTAAQTMLLSVGDVAIIAVLNDSGAVMNIAYEELQQKIKGPLSPLQLRELTAKLASINLQFEPRPQFSSDIDLFTEEYRIVAERPDEVQIFEWDNGLHGAIMHTLTKDMVKPLRDADEILHLVKTGRYTFLTTPQGTFDADSMELAPDSGPDC